MQTFSLFDEILARLTLFHELEQLVPAAFCADRDVGDAARCQLGELLVGLLREIGDAREAAVAVDGGDALLDRVEDLDEMVVGQDEGVSAGKIDASGQLRGGFGDLLDVLDDLLEGDDAEALALLDVAEPAFAMRAAAGYLQDRAAHIVRWTMHEFIGVHARSSLAVLPLSIVSRGGGGWADRLHRGA